MLWERQAERMQGEPCWFSSFRGEPEETAELRGTPDKQERGGSRRGQEKGSKGLIEEEKAWTRLTLRPCRMHKAGTRQETREITSKTAKTNGHQ